MDRFNDKKAWTIWKSKSLFQLKTVYLIKFPSGNNKLQIDMQDWAGNRRYAQYSKFLVLDEPNFYRMFISGKKGTLPGDDMAHHNGMNFATPDRPDPKSCAVNQRAGWWFNYCAYTLPNGIYYYGGPYNPNPSGFYDGIYWKDWGGFNYSMKFISLSLYKWLYLWIACTCSMFVPIFFTCFHQDETVDFVFPVSK